MKYFFLSLWLVMLSGTTLYADSKFELRTDAFIPSNKLYRQIYGQMGSSYQLEMSLSNDRIVDTFLNFDWLSKNGHSTHAHQRTRIQTATLTGGVKFRYHLSELFIPYLGGGLIIGAAMVRNHAAQGLTRHSQPAYGYLLKSGIYMPLNSPFFLDLYMDIFSLTAHFKDEAHLGGIKVGLGIGVEW